MPVRALLLAVAGAVGLVLSASPAAAADIATISCVRDQTLPASIEALLESARQAARGQSGARTPDTLRNDLYDAARKCQKLHGWSETAAEAAAKYTFVALRLEAMRPIAEGMGIQYGNVTASLAAMTQSERDALLTGDQDGLLALLRELGRRGLTSDPKTGELYGRLAALTVLLEQCRKDFVAN